MGLMQYQTTIDAIQHVKIHIHLGFGPSGSPLFDGPLTHLQKFSQTRALKRSCHVIIVSAYWHFPPRFSTKEILNILRSLVPVFREIKIEVLHPGLYLLGRLVIDANGYEKTVDDWALRYSDSRDFQELVAFLSADIRIVG